MKKKTSAAKTPFPPGLAQPALQALAGAGCDHLEQLARLSEEDVRNLHGIGPNALVKLRSALFSLGLSFAQKQTTSPEVDEYLSQFSGDVKAVLEQVRAAIRRSAPDAQEIIGYQMPAFKQHGILVYFAAWKKHIGLYPPIRGDKAIEQAVARYAGPKGNLQFPMDEPIPFALIGRIVKLRVAQDSAKAAAKRKRKSKNSHQPKASE